MNPEQTVAEWNAVHREGGYIPLDHVAAIRREDGTWDIDLRGGQRRIGFICPDTQNSGQWAFQPIIAIRLSEEHKKDIAEAVLIVSGKT